MAAATASSQTAQNPKNPHHLNLQAHLQNSQAGANLNPAFESAQPSTPPRTPQKGNQPFSPCTTNTTAPEAGPKQKSRNKNRPKNVMISPAAVRRGRNTPPLTGAQSAGIPSSAKPIHTPSTAAYAGSTFHASPAPSALPIPSFYSRSVPDSPGLQGLKSLKGAALPTANSTPPRTTQSVKQPPREESPLDFFFKADREEKARARDATSTKAFAPVNGPPLESPLRYDTPPVRPNLTRPNLNRGSEGSSNRTYSSGIFAMELDGDGVSGTPLGPAFSTPYSERINAARSANHSGTYFEQPPLEPQSSIDRSEALKAYLFSGQSLPSFTDHNVPSAQKNLAGHTSPSAPPAAPKNSGASNRLYNNRHHLPTDPKKSDDGHRTGGRSSGLRQEVRPSKTPTRTPDCMNTYATSPKTFSNAPNVSHTENDFVTQFASPTRLETPASPTGAVSGNLDPKIQGMEDSLRRILKLDSASASASKGGQVPPSTVSTPQYTGGRSTN
ncbi:proteophosphoglycan 5 [Diplocarpon rosae]|nr:proteophosphoglycan 5 [Diplocarpon rosae]